MRGEEVVRSLTELLALARLAMPDHLFTIDPRVRRARQLLATLTQVSGSRPPAVIAAPSDLMVDLAPPPTPADVEQMTGPSAPWDITVGLDAFMASGLAPESRTDATILILRDWLVGHGYILPAPEPEDAQ